MINLHFTNSEIKNFLSKEGFKISKIKVWNSYNTYHNRVDNNNFQIEVAYKNDENMFDDNEVEFRYDLVDKFKLENVFQNVIKEKLLNL